jgi:hypothetical protein
LFGQRNEKPSRLEREQSVIAFAAIEQQQSAKAPRQLSENHNLASSNFSFETFSFVYMQKKSENML